MAALAHLSSEEKIGLGLAAAAHAALVIALMWQVGDEPAKLPVPERIEVSLAEDVSLQSTAPAPAQASAPSVAPSLAEQPEPPAAEPEPAPPEPVRAEPVRVEPPRPLVRPAPQPTRAAVAKPTPAPRPSARPTARPSPAPRPSARPAPSPTARATPAPRPSASASARPAPRANATPAPRATQAARPSGGSRIGADFLRGTSADARTEARGTPAATFGPAEQASLIQSISRQIKPHWSAPQGPDAELLVTVLRFQLNPDGSLAGNPEVVSQSGDNATNAAQKQRHAEQAIRAVRLAAPFDLPEQFYDRWKRVSSLRFDRRL